MSEEAEGQDKASRGGNRVAPQPEGRRTRRSRFSSSGDADFEVPAKYRKEEMSYQWWAVKVINQEVDAANHVVWADGGWDPVRPAEMPEMVPAGYKGNTIDRRGLRLYKRPIYLTEEALAEDRAIANEQKNAKLAQALATPNDSAPRVGSKIDFGIGSPVKD